MERKYLIAIVAVVAVAIVAAGILASGALNPANDPTVIRHTVIAPKDQEAAIQKGTVDGGVSWEPYVSDSVVAGTGKVLLHSADYWPNHPCCVIAVDREWAADNPEVVMRFLKAHVEATEWIQQALAQPDSENYTKLMSIGAAFSFRSTDVVEEATKHMHIGYNITEQSKSYLANYTQAYMDLNLIPKNKIGDMGYSSVEDFVDKYVNTEYLEGIGSVQPTNEMTVVDVGYLAGDLHQFARVVAEDSTILDGTPYEGKSIFEKYGIDTRTPVEGGYAVGGDVMTAFNMGQIKIGYLGSPPAILRHLNNNIQTEIVALANTEGSAIVVNEDINSLEELGGKMIASPGPSSIQYLFLLSVAQDNDLRVQLG